MITSDDINKSVRKGFIKSFSLFFIIIIISCTPSKKFLIKRNENIGTEKKTIRVLVRKSGETVKISSTDKIKITDLKTTSVKYNGQGRVFNFNPDKIVNPIVIETWGSPLTVDETSYRGSIEIRNVMGKLNIINVVTMDEYLSGVVPSEMTFSWNDEALKAQAVASRTFAYYHLMTGSGSYYDIDASTNFQVYRGFSAENEKTNRSVRETSGEIVSYQYRPILTYFHSTCGGRTISGKYVWDKSELPYITGVRCSFCLDSPKYQWTEKLTLDEIGRAIKRKNAGVGRIKGISFQKHEGRVVSVKITHKNGIIKLSGNQFRLLFPPMKIKSLMFSAKKMNGGLALEGHGFGHGVGMCQWGARGMSESGKNYRDILNYYYKDIKIININTIAQKNRGNHSRQASN
jgi:stage II sporulation protein D